MRRIFQCCTNVVVFASLSLLPFSLFAATSTPESVVDSSLETSAIASQSWLELVDKGQYAESWEKSSALMKKTVTKDEWVQILTTVRKPLGSVSSRQVVDQRKAQNPHGLPAGDYIVMFYKTVFSAKPTANELVTLYLDNGQWNVLTYQVN